MYFFSIFSFIGLTRGQLFDMHFLICFPSFTLTFTLKGSAKNLGDDLQLLSRKARISVSQPGLRRMVPPFL